MRSSHSRGAGDGGLHATHRQQRRRIGGAFAGMSRRETILVALVLGLGGTVLLASFFGASDVNLPATGSAGLSASQRLKRPAHHRRLGAAEDRSGSDANQQSLQDRAQTDLQNVAQELWDSAGTQNTTEQDSEDAQHVSNTTMQQGHETDGDRLGASQLASDDKVAVHGTDATAVYTGTERSTAAQKAATDDVGAAHAASDGNVAGVGNSAGLAKAEQGANSESSGRRAVPDDPDAAAANAQGQQQAVSDNDGDIATNAQKHLGMATFGAGDTDAGEAERVVSADSNASGNVDDTAEDAGNKADSEDEQDNDNDDDDDDSGDSAPDDSDSNEDTKETEEEARNRQWWESLSDEERARIQAEAEAEARRAMRDKWDHMRPFVLDVLAQGLPSERTGADVGAGGGPKLKLYPVRQRTNPTPTEWEFRYGTDWGSVPTIIKRSQEDWYRPEAFTADKLEELVGGDSVFQPQSECADGSAKRDTTACHHILQPAATSELHKAPRWQGVNATSLDIKTYADLLRVQGIEAERGHFLHAHEVPVGRMPALAEHVHVPRYFLNNYNDLSSAPNITLDSMVTAAATPAISISPAGASTPLHAEGAARLHMVCCTPVLQVSSTQMLRRWETQLQGRRLVRLVPPSEERQLHSNITPSGVNYDVDVMQPDFSAHPQLRGMLVYEALLQPGDVLFVPSGWAHQSLNLEWSLALSSRYLDQHNQDLYLEWQDQHEDDYTMRLQLRQVVDSFFLPMRAPSADNPSLHEFFSWHALEQAPVSAAAEEFIGQLENLKLHPDQWRDRASKPVLYTAVQWNYFHLAEWLLDRGCTLNNMSTELLAIADASGFAKLGSLLRQKLQKEQQAETR